MSQKSVMSLSMCVVRSPSLSSGRIKGMHCDLFLVRLLNLYNQRTLQRTTNNHSIPPSRSTTHPLSTSTLTCQGRVLQPFLATSTNVPSTNVVTLARWPVQHRYCYSSSWKTGWGFPAGAKAPPRKGMPWNPVQSRRTLACASWSSAPYEGILFSLSWFLREGCEGCGG